ncbi:MAG: GntR family transcriptional regulator [Bryobacteraceae bacterium]
MTHAAQIRIDLDSAAPVNRQIVDQLRTLLVEGAVAPDDTLPSVRRLAIDLGVHFNTVADAYRTLADEGWLEIAHGRGVRVRKRQAPRRDREAQEETLLIFRRRLRQLAAEMRAQGLSPEIVVRELASLMEVVKS